MKFILLADIHGSGRTEEERGYAVQVLEDAFEFAKLEQAEAVVVLGDLLHFKYGLELRLLLEWSELITEYAEQGIQFIAISGNHDCPWKGEPDKVAIKLLPGNIYTEPTSFVQEGTLYCFLPWSDPSIFKQQAAHFAHQARSHTGLKFLFAHTSLAEGFVSPSNHQVEQQIRMGDLFPDDFDKVLLGDYHSSQNVGTKILYLGAPRPTTFGDSNNRGCWCLDVRKNGIWYLNNLGLLSEFPDYIQLTLGPGDDPFIPDFNPKNKYIVHCPASLLSELGVRYPGIIPRTLPGTFTILKEARFKSTSVGNPILTFRAWMELKGLDPTVYGPIGEEVLMQCLGQVR